MPVNSALNSVDKSVPLLQAINIIISEDLEELLVWDQELSKWIWMLTTTDIIRLLMYALHRLTKNLPIRTYPLIARYAPHK